MIRRKLHGKGSLGVNESHVKEGVMERGGFVTHLLLKGMSFRVISANLSILLSQFIILASSNTTKCVKSRVVGEADQSGR